MRANRLLLMVGLLAVLSACGEMGISAEVADGGICPVTQPERLTPPDDAAVPSQPAEGLYFANGDRSILAAAWWLDADEPLVASEDGIKVGWFRPEGADLLISGERLDGDAPPLEASVPCCYPTRFQATGLTFPTEGCWEVVAISAESELSFVVEVAPDE